MKGEPRSKVGLKNKEKTNRSVYSPESASEIWSSDSMASSTSKAWLTVKHTAHSYCSCSVIITYTHRHRQHNTYPQFLTRLGCPVRPSCAEHTRHGWNRKSHWEKTRIVTKTCPGHISRPVSGHSNLHEDNYACFFFKNVFFLTNVSFFQFSHCPPCFHIFHPKSQNFPPNDHT